MEGTNAFGQSLRFIVTLLGVEQTNRVYLYMLLYVHSSWNVFG